MPEPMPLRPTTIRFAEDAMDLVHQAALEAGVSVSQFVREAAIMRAAALLPEAVPNLERLSRNQED
jgi:uncharacterized protein (DUF1778 family)